MTYIAVSDAGWTAAGTLALAVATGVAIAVTLILARRDRIRGDADAWRRSSAMMIVELMTAPATTNFGLRIVRETTGCDAKQPRNATAEMRPGGVQRKRPI